MRSAIIGCGSIAKTHAEVINKLPENQIVAVADCKLEAAESLRESFGYETCKAYESLEEMIAAEEIDVLHICTPHHLHVPMAVYALEHNINVFMEKPPAISKEQFQELQLVASKAKLGVCFQNRYNKSVEITKALLDSGQVGKILGARAVVTWQRNEDYYAGSEWKGRLATEGGGVLINQAIHTLDLLGYFIGEPTAVEATSMNHHLKGIVEVEDTIEAYIKFGDIGASFYATTAFCTNSPILLELVLEDRTIRIEGNEVTYIFSDGRKEILDFEAEGHLGKDYWGNGHFACIEDFYVCLKNDMPFKIDINEVAKVQRLMLGIYESANTKSVVYL